ncbi:MAG: hypothetical protein ABEH43_01615 [Flavobacteriales bacterium]
MEIEKLEEFINRYKHLPGVPPQSKVKKNGLSLGNMQKRMMEKVEEQALYIVQLDKKNKEQDKEIEKLKKEVAKIKQNKSTVQKSGLERIVELILTFIAGAIVLFFLRFNNIGIKKILR